jgi:hypothetical protein
MLDSDLKKMTWQNRITLPVVAIVGMITGMYLPGHQPAQVIQTPPTIVVLPSPSPFPAPHSHTPSTDASSPSSFTHQLAINTIAWLGAMNENGSLAAATNEQLDGIQAALDLGESIAKALECTPREKKLVSDVLQSYSELLNQPTSSTEPRWRTIARRTVEVLRKACK